MDIRKIDRTLRGPFNFLRPEPEEVLTLLPDADRIFPAPQQIFLEDESATPLVGFPVLTDHVGDLREALAHYLDQEVRLHVAEARRRPHDAREHRAAWEAYSGALRRMTENTATSSYGRDFPSIFWLFHSFAVARLMKELPRRALEVDLQLGRERGDELKYRIFHRYFDRILQLTYDEVQSVARETDEPEEHLFPALLRTMGDNVLILTEDHVGRDLAELGSYLNGCLGLDPRDFRQRLAELRSWNAAQLESDQRLRTAAATLLGWRRSDGPDRLLRRPGWARLLSREPGYAPARLLPPELVDVWEKLLLHLKEFELILGLRRRVIPVHREGEQLVCRDPGLSWSGGGHGDLQLSGATRPLDFAAPWVVDPLVHRFGLIYDMTSFSEIVSELRHLGRDVQERSFRQIFRFQRRVNQLARQHRLKLEKYLGDGALYSGRHPRRLLAVAVQLQRYYARVVEAGFPFDRGVRLALNYGAYRLLPIQGEEAGDSGRYEFLGHGIVELSRLVTGKATRDIDEIKTLLLSRGYPPNAVDRFFAPMVQRNVDLTDRQAETRTFYAYINRNGNLINEGIVATGDFVEQLDEDGGAERFRRGRLDSRSYLVVEIAEDGVELTVGLTKLGLASFKGLGQLAVYEVVDGDRWQPDELETFGGEPTTLLAALDREALRPARPSPQTP